MNTRGIRYLVQSYSEMTPVSSTHEMYDLYDEYPDESLDTSPRASPGLFMLFSVAQVLVKLVDQEETSWRQAWSAWDVILNQLGPANQTCFKLYQRGLVTQQWLTAAPFQGCALYPKTKW